MSAIRSVVVAGNGVEAWIAAAALRRAFRAQPLDVRVVATDGADARVGRWTLPSQRGMHALLGIAEPAFVTQTGATFKLASEHLGWQGDGSRFLHAHGEIGAAMGATPFYKYLLGEALSGRPQAPETFSLAGAAARLGRFARPMGEDRALTARFTYGFHLEDAAYATFLRSHAQRLGVSTASAPLADVRLGEGGHIEALRLADGSEVVADYFFDCSGSAASLLTRVAPHDARDDWSAWLPCDRMWSAMAPPLDDPPAVTRTTAAAAGWLWRAPLATGSMVGFVYSSRFQQDAAAEATLRSFEPALSGEPTLMRISPGRRRRFWARNCVALGQAALEIEPLVGGDLHFAQLGLASFLELVPLDRRSTVEADEYNRVMAEHADALRDFTLAHYRAGSGRSGEFWKATRAIAPPARLADKLDSYGASGRINLLDHETFEETDWAWLLIGSGWIPDALELQVRLQLDKLSAREIGSLREHVQQIAASMPRHIEFVRHQAKQPARAPG